MSTCKRIFFKQKQQRATYGGLILGVIVTAAIYSLAMIFGVGHRELWPTLAFCCSNLLLILTIFGYLNPILFFFEYYNQNVLLEHFILGIFFFSIYYFMEAELCFHFKIWKRNNSMERPRSKPHTLSTERGH